MKEITKHEINKVWENIEAYGGSPDSRLLVCEVLASIPEQCRDKILDDTIFLLNDDAQGTLHGVPILNRERKQIHTQKIIRICFITFKDCVERTRTLNKSTIAHECAHSYLDHHLTESRKGKPTAQIEKETDDLAEQWGFGRSYKSYEPLAKEDWLQEEKESFHIIRVPLRIKEKLMRIDDRKLSEYLIKTAPFLDYEV